MWGSRTMNYWDILRDVWPETWGKKGGWNYTNQLHVIFVWFDNLILLLNDGNSKEIGFSRFEMEDYHSSRESEGGGLPNWVAIAPFLSWMDLKWPLICRDSIDWYRLYKWAILKNLGCLGYIGDDILPSYVGIMINYYCRHVLLLGPRTGARGTWIFPISISKHSLIPWPEIAGSQWLMSLKVVWFVYSYYAIYASLWRMCFHLVSSY